jgi:hypothetical protein
MKNSLVHPILEKSPFPALPPGMVVHDWLRPQRVTYVPGAAAAEAGEGLAEGTARRLVERLRHSGQTVLDDPHNGPDILLTTARFGQPVSWRKALLFTARIRYRLARQPLVFTLIHMTPAEFNQTLANLEQALARQEPHPADFAYPGLAPRAYLTLYEQGRRGGPMLSLVRLLQAQSLSIRIILVVGEDEPQEAYTFDLVGAHPRTPAEWGAGFYDDLVLRMLTAASTHEITEHETRGEPLPLADWRLLEAPPAMLRAGRELGARSFFTEMVVVANLTTAPAVHEAVSSQYSEGCFATWDAGLGALVATITGSARPVDKGRLTEDELAVITGVRPDGGGALVRNVQGKRNDPPSSEAVEMFGLDLGLPNVELGPDWLPQGGAAQAPVARSKLHGHRGVRSFDPQRVEHVWLDEAYYHYPVSCSTEAQARAICAAFARSEALRSPADPRQVVFTILPGHGVVIVEKWVPGKAPLQLVWEYMDAGYLQISNHIPQGPFQFPVHR